MLLVYRRMPPPMALCNLYEIVERHSARLLVVSYWASRGMRRRVEGQYRLPINTLFGLTARYCLVQPYVLLV